MSVPRVSAEQVKEIINTEIADDVLQTSMIDTAHLVIDDNLLTVGHSTKLLEKIELYLSAHFVAVTEQEGTLTLDKLGDSTQEWDSSNLGKGYSSTTYGQTALALDSSGVLAAIATASLKAEFRVI